MYTHKVIRHNKIYARQHKTKKMIQQKHSLKNQESYPNIMRNRCTLKNINSVEPLPTDIKNLSHNVNQFRSALSDFLRLNLFYTLEEYFNNGNKLMPCL
jgi:PP-loop superfamily ATP-utilizing enzyme